MRSEKFAPLSATTFLSLYALDATTFLSLYAVDDVPKN
jgi:hypothetical protein